MIKIYFIFIALLIIINSDVKPCSCIGEATIQQEFDNSDVVILGKVISEQLFIINDKVIPKGLIFQMVKYKIKVEDSYKGEFQKDTIVIITGKGHGD